MKNEKTFASKCGTIFANVVIACIAVCLSSLVIAGTVRLITWLI